MPKDKKTPKLLYKMYQKGENIKVKKNRTMPFYRDLKTAI